MFLGLKFIFLVVPILLCVAFITLLERKILGVVGFRLGPNKVSLYGVLQPIMDAVKLANKQSNSLYNSSFLIYYLSASFILLGSLLLWLTHFSDPSFMNVKFSILIIMILLAFNSLNSIISGWSTFSKFSLIGSIRTVAQLVSYEAVLYLIFFFFISIYLVFNSYNFNFYPNQILFLCFPFCFYFWLPTVLAELNRTPYDFSPGESELVSGFNTEFGSGAFTLIFLAEYSNIVFFSFLTAFIFFFDLFNIFFFYFFFFVIWIRSVLPRYRFDKLMMLSWKFFVPFLTVLFIGVSLLLF